MDSWHFTVARDDSQSLFLPESHDQQCLDIPYHVRQFQLRLLCISAVLVPQKVGQGKVEDTCCEMESEMEINVTWFLEGWTPCGEN